MQIVLKFKKKILRWWKYWLWYLLQSACSWLFDVHYSKCLQQLHQPLWFWSRRLHWWYLHNNRCLRQETTCSRINLEKFFDFGLRGIMVLKGYCENLDVLSWFKFFFSFYIFDSKTIRSVSIDYFCIEDVQQIMKICFYFIFSLFSISQY